MFETRSWSAAQRGGAFFAKKYLIIDIFAKCLFVCAEIRNGDLGAKSLKPGHGELRSAAAHFLPRNIWPKASKATAVLKLPGNKQDLNESLI